MAQVKVTVIDVVNAYIRAYKHDPHQFKVNSWKSMHPSRLRIELNKLERGGVNEKN